MNSNIKVSVSNFLGGYLVENNSDSEFPSLDIKEENNASWQANTAYVNKKYPGPVAAGILFSIATMFLTYGGVLLPFENKYLKSGLGEVIFVLLPVLVFLIVGKYNIKDTLKLRRTRPINYLIIVFLTMFAMPVVGVLNLLVLGLIRLVFGKNLPIDQILIPDIPTLFIAILVIGVSAAVCEETLFRGLISKGYDRFGVIASLVITSVLFGILHRDIQKGVSTILLGALIGYIVYRTKSIYSGMVAHFTNNTVAVILTYWTAEMSERLGKTGYEQAQNLDFSNIPTVSLVIAIIIYAIAFLAFVAVFIVLLYVFYRSTQKDNQSKTLPVQFHLESEAEQTILKSPQSKFSLAGLIAVLPGVIIILLIFVGQILELMNVNSGVLYDLLKMLWLK